MGLIFEVAEGGALDIDVKIEGIILLLTHQFLIIFLRSLLVKLEFVYEKFKCAIVARAELSNVVTLAILVTACS